ncbi:MAG: hypothetical protein CMJ86_03325 [Planctomycetes bacterium]|nr:hypothetical protein [Planctomycetota bacterium]
MVAEDSMKRVCLILLFVSCGGRVEPGAVEQQILYGRLESAEELLGRMDPDHPSRKGLQAQIDGVWAERERAKIECATLRAGRDSRSLESLLASLDDLAQSFTDGQARETVLREKSVTLDWDADRRSRKSHLIARAPRGDPAPDEEQEPAVLPRIQGLIKSIMLDVEAASRSGEYARALALLDQLIGDLPAQASMLGVELLEHRESLRSAADQGARRLIAGAESAQRLRGDRAAWDLVAEEYLRFPESTLDGEFSRRVEQWRQAVSSLPNREGDKSEVAVADSDAGTSLDPLVAPPAAEVAPTVPQTGDALGVVARPYPLTSSELLADPGEQALMGEKARVAGDLPRAIALLQVASRLTQDPESARYRRREMECRWLAALAKVWSLEHAEGGATRGIALQLKALGHQGTAKALLELGDKPPVSLGIMVACLADGAPKFNELGLTILWEQRAGGLLTSEHTDLLVAQARGEEVPDGGYSLVAGSFVATVEHQEQLIGAKLKLELRKLTTRQGAAREEAWEVLAVLADQYRLAEIRLAETLDDFLVRQTNRILKRGEFKRLQQLAVRRRNLEVAREFALELIFDEQAYFYPIPDNRRGEYNLVQRRVDDLVAEVRAIWEQPFSVSLGAAFHEDLGDLQWVLGKLQGSSLPKDLPSWLFLIQPEVTDLSLANFAPNRAVQTEIRISSHVRAYNENLWAAEEEVCRSQESEQVRVTNRYRRLLGRVALAWDARLQAATVVHGEYMSRTGIFSHFEEGVPGRRTPFERMTEQGYTQGLGENIHGGAGDPLGAHFGWTHSSGHHRALLSRQATEMATSVVGRYWTQNFGTGRDSRRSMD